MLKTKTVKAIELEDWNNFVTEVYGKPYNYQRQDGLKEKGAYPKSVPSRWTYDFKNTEIPFEVNGEEMGVSFETWLNTSPKDTIEYFKDDYENDNFWEETFYPDVNMIINDLHSRGLMEAGEYLIIIDW